MNLWTAKARTYLVWAAALAVIASPARQYRRPREDQVDGFPLSHYPMFSARRSRTGSVTHLVGIGADGSERILHHRHAGTGGLNQVRRQITRQVRDGRAQALADRVARSLASQVDSSGRVTTVQVVTSRHRYDAFFAGERAPRSRTVHATARVPLPGDPGGAADSTGGERP